MHIIPTIGRTDPVRKLKTLGACSVKVLSEVDIAPLVEETRRLVFKQREQQTATGVLQNFSGCDQFELHSPFLALARETEQMLNQVFGYMVSIPITLNDYSLQSYPVSSPEEKYAISPHRDHKNCINLIAVFVLKGIAPFCICADRTGSRAKEVYSRPGDLILMRGTGFLESEIRPYHFVGRVTTERLTFGLRQTVDRMELPKYYKPSQMKGDS